MTTLYYNLLFCTIYFSFALAGHRGTCLRPLHIFALLLLCFVYFVPPLTGFPLELGIGARSQKKLELGGYWAEKEV